MADASGDRTQEVRVEPGDLLFVRVGHRSRRAALGPWDAANTRAGLQSAALELLAERRIAALDSDGNNNKRRARPRVSTFRCTCSPSTRWACTCWTGCNSTTSSRCAELKRRRSSGSSRLSGSVPRPARRSTRSLFLNRQPAARPRKEHSMDGHYDVIIIGTGAGGGTLARHLAASGKRILLLERGDWPPPPLPPPSPPHPPPLPSPLPSLPPPPPPPLPPPPPPSSLPPSPLPPLKHPNGLANGSDQVGRNFMYHDSQAVLALSKDPNPTVFQKTLGVNDFYFSGPDFDYPMGNIQMIGKSSGHVPRRKTPRDQVRADLGAARRHRARRGLLAVHRGPAAAKNRVTLGPDGAVHLAYTPSNPTAAKRLYHQLHSMLGSLRMHPGHLAHRFAYMKTDIPVAGCATRPGPSRSARTCRIGTQPRLPGPRTRQPLRRRHQLFTRASARSTRPSPRWPTPSGSATTCSNGSAEAAERWQADQGQPSAP